MNGHIKFRTKDEKNKDNFIIKEMDVGDLFIGLYDINNKEIYENDRVEIVGYKIKGTIKFYNGAYAVYNKRYGYFEIDGKKLRLLN